MSLICACIRLSYGFSRGTKFSVGIWAVIEATTALCVASAPALRPLIFQTSYFVRGTSNKHAGSANSRPMTREMTGMRGTRVSSLPLRNNDDIQQQRILGTKIRGVHVTEMENETLHTCSDSYFERERKESDTTEQGYQKM